MTWELSHRFDVVIELDSDWHIGSGSSQPGNVDATVARAEDGLPYIPAKSLRGVWRRACEAAARALDDGARGDWTAWVDVIFGDQPAIAPAANGAPPRGGLLIVGSARLEERDFILSHPELAAAITIVKAGVKIDGESGRALDGHLRFEEVARGGAVLHAPVELLVLPSDVAARRTLSALLLAGLRLVDGIGAHRRRGLGRCRCWVKDVDAASLEATWQWLEKLAAPPSPPAETCVVETEPQAEASFAGLADDGGACLRIPLFVELDQPVVAMPEVRGNVVSGRDFIAGSLLLAVVTRCLENAGVSDVRGNIARGTIQVLNAHLDVGGARGRPAPQVLLVAKGSTAYQPGQVSNALLDEAAHGKALRDKWLGPSQAGQLPVVASARRVTMTHNTIDDAAERPVSSVGGLYTYEALAAGQRFRSELRVPQHLVARLPEGWWKPLSTTLRLGRSKKDDYGAARVTAGPVSAQAMAITGEAASFVVWLQSECLLVDANLRPDPSLDQLGRVLGERLGVTLRMVAGRARVSRVESWHRGWNLPRASLVGLAAGTVARFEVVDGKVPRSDLSRIADEGIGERRGEGFGEFEIDPAFLMRDPSSLSPASAEVSSAAPVRAGEAGPYSRLLQREVDRKRIADAALALASDPGRRAALLGSRVPSPSQLGALRAVASRVRDAAGVSQLRSWLDAVKATKTRRDKWSQAALDALERIFQSAPALWSRLEIDAPHEETWAEGLRVLIDALVRAARTANAGALEGEPS